MKPHSHRRTNLLRLINERFEGKKGRFADAIGRERPLIYRLFSNTAGSKRNIGEELARDIEHKLGLTPGWLDQDHTTQAEAEMPTACTIDIPPELAPLVWDLCLAYHSKQLTPAVKNSFRHMVRAPGERQLTLHNLIIPHKNIRSAKFRSALE